MRNKIKNAVLVLSIILVPVVIVLGCGKLLVMNEWFYHTQFEKLGVYANIGHPRANLALENVFDFLEGNAQLDRSMFRKEEASHMQDVKKLMFKSNLFFYITANILAVCYIFFYFYRKGHIKKSLVYGSGLTLAIISALYLFAAADFGGFFTGFHEIFFEEGTWMFPAESMLKTLFPDRFFLNFLTAVITYSAIISLVIVLGFTHAIKRLESRRNESKKGKKRKAKNKKKRKK